MTRNQKGIIGWAVLSVLLGFLCFPVMVAREYYQYKHYHLARFEWDDILRYGIVITIGSAVHAILITLVI